MKKHKLISIFSAATAAMVIVPVVAVSCGRTETGTPTPGTPGSTTTIKSEENRTIALGNIQGTAGQVQAVYTNALDAVTKVAAKVTDAAQKTALTAFGTSLKTLVDAIAANASGTATGALRVKIAALKTTEADYGTKLTAVKTDLLKNVADVLAAYKTLVKAMDSAATDATITTEFNKLSELSKFFGTYSIVAAPNTQLLDLARLFEAFNGGISGTAVGKYDSDTTTDAKVKIKTFATTIAQIFNLITKRELQTVVMAEAIDKAGITEAKIKTSLEKQKALRVPRKAIATLPAVFVTKVNGLKAQIKSLTDAFAEVEKKKAITGVTALATDIQKKYDDLKANITTINNRYSGNTALNPPFVRKGLEKNVSDLDTALKALPNVEVDSIATFNDIYKKASPTWTDAAGMYVNALVSSNVVKASKTLVTELVAAITSTKTEDAALKTELQKLTPILTRLETEYGELTSQTPNTTPANEVSAWKLNQNVRAISSYVQILLLQIAVDELGLTPADYAFGPVTTS